MGKGRDDRLTRPGDTCWRLARADQFGVAVDAETYFRALAEVLPQATQQILMLGWEFDSRTRLCRGGSALPKGGWPNHIGALLDAVVRRRPGLVAHVLIWDSALIYAVNREFGGLVKMDWLTHPSLHFRLDDSHPLGGSHHQKIVVIDDRLAFVGGLDVTSQRWDSRQHSPRDMRRSDPAMASYPPFHDVMAVVSGDAARALGDLCRERWRASAGEVLPPPGDGGRLWPVTIPPLLSGIPVALSRTCPPWDGTPPVHEVERLTLAMIGAARRFIFIENQYFAARRIADAIAARLAEPAGPEVVIIGPGRPISLMERSSMGVARARLVRHLACGPGGQRFGLYTPTVEGTEVKVHSKVMIIDDKILRIGSANLNNRSLGLDSECDLTLEAQGDRGVTAAIRHFRHDLLAEHLGIDPAMVAATESECGSIHGAIAGLSHSPRRLVPLDYADPQNIVTIVADSSIPDPVEPMEALLWREDSLPGPPGIGRRIRALTLVLAGLAGLAALWRWAPPGLWQAAGPWLHALATLRGEPALVAVVAVLFILGGVLRVPLVVLMLANAAMLGPWLGAAGSLAGVLVSGSLHYLLGRRLGHRLVLRLLGSDAIHRVSDGLSRHGIAAIVLLRLMPVAGFAVVNLVAGAAHMRFRDFLVGTLFGMVPATFAMSVLGDRVLAVLRTPSMVNIAVLGMATALVTGALFGLVNRLGRARALPRPRHPQEA